MIRILKSHFPVLLFTVFFVIVSVGDDALPRVHTSSKDKHAQVPPSAPYLDKALADVQRVWTDARAAEGSVSLRHLYDVSWEIAQAALDVEARPQASEALGLAAKIADEAARGSPFHPQWRAMFQLHADLNVAEGYAELSDDDKAGEAFERALDRAPQPDKEHQAAVQLRSLTTQWRLGRIKDARETLRSLAETQHADSARSDLSLIKASAGKIDDALRMAENIEDEGRRLPALYRVMYLAIHHGDIDNLFTVLRSFPEPIQWELYIEAGELLARSNEESLARKMFAEAIGMAEEREGPPGSSRIFTRIAVKMSEVGFLDDVSDLLKHLNTPLERFRVYVALAKGRAETGGEDEANEALNEAMEVFADVEHDEGREAVELWLSLARAQGMLSRQDELRASLESAHDAATDIPNADSRARRCREIAVTYAQYESVEGALEIATSHEVETAGHTSIAKREIAVAVAERGNEPIEKAVGIAQKIRSVRHQGPAYREIAAIQAGRSDVDKAKEWIERLDVQLHSAHAWLGVSEGIGNGSDRVIIHGW